MAVVDKHGDQWVWIVRKDLRQCPIQSAQIMTACG